MTSPRYGVRAKGDGHAWAVYDNENTHTLATGHKDPLDIEYFHAETEMGNVKPGAWDKAHREAVKRAAELNAKAEPIEVEAKDVTFDDVIEGLGKVVAVMQHRGSYITFMTEHKGQVRYTKRQLVKLISRGMVGSDG